MHLPRQKRDFAIKMEIAMNVSHRLTGHCLTLEGFVCYDGFPVAFIKSDLSVLLLLPFDELRRRPYYSATFNGFIELHYSVSKLCPHFTLALIAEWTSRYFSAPRNNGRSIYVRQAIEQLLGWHHGLAELAYALTNPEDDLINTALPQELKTTEADVLNRLRKSTFPIYFVNGFWSNHLRTANGTFQPSREARRLVRAGAGYLQVVTSTDLLVRIDQSLQENLLGFCIRKINAVGTVTGTRFLPRLLWKKLVFNLGQKQFLTAGKMQRLLPRSALNPQTKDLDEALTALAWLGHKTVP